MHIGRRYSIGQTLWWSKYLVLVPAVWSCLVVMIYKLLHFRIVGLPWLPISAIGVAVAFYLGFKNNASYDRLWEARKIWGAIVNASRSWAFSARDLVSNMHRPGDLVDASELDAVRRKLVLRHVAWMDALRFQLRKVKSWEHQGPMFDRVREDFVPELKEELAGVLGVTLSDDERAEVTSMINPAAHLLANQSRDLAELRRRGLLDAFAHMELQKLLHELMTQQGKAERIKNFPFPRQYATVNGMFAGLFTLLVPFGMVAEFAGVGEGAVWLAIPFSTAVSWVFLTTDKIGDWSENPFEGLHNDVPITSMARGIERDIRQMVGDTSLPPAREPAGDVIF